MRVIEANSFEEFEAKEKEVLDLGFLYADICEVRKIVIYRKHNYEIRIKCNFWN